MLVLSRKIQQQILIPGLNIRLTVLSVGKNRVQLGIEAPQGIQITRPESGRRAPASFPPVEPQGFDFECNNLDEFTQDPSAAAAGPG